MSARTQMDWVGGLPDEDEEGVGARQSQHRPSRRGGGYLNKCNPSELWEEAKFAELDAMGLPGFWVDLAHEVGYDTFMKLWRALDAEIELRDESDSMIFVKLRRYKSFKRFQRNRMIESLVHLQQDLPTIKDKVRSELGEELSDSHMTRLVNRFRIAA